jgi:iron(III) transport system ATP-binding protein
VLSLEGVSRTFGETVAVNDLSLRVAEGELLTLLGPSGCGKTTTLRMIGGFERPSAGRVVIGGRDVTALPPQARQVGMVFQSYALFPHLDVAENVAFGLRSRGVARPVEREKVARALALVELEAYGARKVHELSGGQQQRIALARALAPEPPLLLLDEPLSNLDAALRERTRDEIRALLKRLGMTAVFVTHDQEEAFALSDRVAVLESGRLRQLGTPEELYATPGNAFVAGFLGRANFLDATLVEDGAGGLAGRLRRGTTWPVAPAAELRAGDEATLMTRPEGLRFADADDADAVRGRVLDRRFAGATTFYRIETEDGETVLVEGPADGAATGDAVGIRIAPASAAVAFPREPTATRSPRTEDGR